MYQVLVSEQDIEQLEGHVRLVRQGANSAVGAALGAFASGYRTSSASLAIEAANDVIALCDYCTGIGEILLAHAIGAQVQSVEHLLDTVRELAEVADRTRHLAELALRCGGMTTHPSIKHALRDLALRIDRCGMGVDGQLRFQAS